MQIRLSSLLSLLLLLLHCTELGACQRQSSSTRYTNIRGLSLIVPRYDDQPSKVVPGNIESYFLYGMDAMAEFFFGSEFNTNISMFPSPLQYAQATQYQIIPTTNETVTFPYQAEAILTTGDVIGFAGTNSGTATLSAGKFYTVVFAGATAQQSLPFLQVCIVSDTGL